MISLKQAMSLLRKAPILVGIGFVTAVAAAVAVALLVPATYSSTASLVLVAPNQQPDSQTREASAQNPLLSFDPSLSTTATILLERLNSREVQDRLGVRSGAGLNLTVTDASEQTSNDFQVVRPFLYIDTSAGNPAAAEVLATRASDEIKANLRNQQSQVLAPTNQFIQVIDVVTPTAAVPSNGVRFAYGVGAALAILAYVVGLAIYRGRRRSITPESSLSREEVASDASASFVKAYGPRERQTDSPTTRIQR